MRDWPGQIQLWVARGDLPGWLQAELFLLAKDYEKAELAHDLNATLAVEEPFRALAEFVLDRLDRGPRWPCRHCGRENALAPLKALRVLLDNGEVQHVGCWMCMTGDELVAKAKRALSCR